VVVPITGTGKEDTGRPSLTLNSYSHLSSFEKNLSSPLKWG